MRIFRQHVHKLLLFAASALLCLLAMDVILYYGTNLRHSWRKVFVIAKESSGSFYYVVPDDDPYFQPRNQPYFFTTEKYIAQIPGGIYIPFDDEARLRGRNPERPKRAAIVGDSFVIGEGVRNEDSLGWMLNDEYPECNFLNYGRTGIEIYTVANRIRENILPENPKIRDVIYFYNLNDVDHVWPANERLTDFENIDYQHTAWRGILKKSTLLSLLKKAVVMHRETRRTTQLYFDLYFGADNSSRRDGMLDTLIQINKELADKGVRFHVVIYPLLHKTPLGTYPFAPIHELIMRHCAAHSISCFDAAKAFSDCLFMSRMRVNPADYHPNAKANRRVARFVRGNIKLSA